MSNISVDNLNETRELNIAKREELKGGLSLDEVQAMIADTMLVSVDVKEIGVNENNIAMVTGANGVNYAGTINTFSLNTGNLNILEA